MAPTREAPRAQDWIAELSAEVDEGTRRELVRANAQPPTPELVELVYNEALRLGRVDLDRAQRLADALTWLAADMGSQRAAAQASRLHGHILYLRGRYQPALENYRLAVHAFDALGEEIESARTINAALQSMGYLGQYDEAFALAERARNTFAAAGDGERLARLDGNIANLLYRQDRCEQAIAYYDRAQRYFVEHNTSPDIALNLRNMAVCYIGLNQFDKALAAYAQARDFAVAQGLPLLGAEADYNIAYVYYLRGEYTQAIDLYQATRVLCDRLGDPYHKALCDLDQAEIYLELNLVAEAAELSTRAHRSFHELGMRYESAKALTFLAIASSRLGRAERALQLFERARTTFVRESNQLWPALLDLYKSLVLFDRKEYEASRALCEAALQAFRSSPLPGKAAVCELLLARLDTANRDTAAAGERCRAALRLVESADAPAVSFQAHTVFGQVLEASGDWTGAYEEYERAHHALEALRTQLYTEELKVAFLKDKLSVYEGLVELAMRQGSQRTAFEYMERAKSRTLADLIAFRVHALPPSDHAATPFTSEVRSLHEKLAAAQRQSARAPLQPNPPSPERLERLRQEARTYEGAFIRAASELGAADRELAALLSAGTKPLEEIREQIPANALLLEYYEARGTLYACIVGRTQLRIVRLGPSAPVSERFRFLQFQLSKFRLGAEYVRTFSQPLQAATMAHLQAIGDALIAPLRRDLQADHLIIVPHGVLHYLPFHALVSGGKALLDDFSISYSPSASVYQLCCVKPEARSRDSLVLGIPDPLAPHILGEANAVASALPNARLFIGDSASEDIVHRYAPNSRFVHIATHGLFRQDNPMFSSIRLGKSAMSLFDLYQLRLSAELVTLSGCGTGLNVVVGGDELLGLVRGLLYAGARCALVTLWDVNDETTAEFMKSFYELLGEGYDKAAAWQRAMQGVRSHHPHPYYWAPFILIGSYL